MIYNTLVNPRQGRGMSPVWVKTLTALRQYIRLSWRCGGMRTTARSSLWVEVMSLTTAPAQAHRTELHLDYAAIHLLIRGEERIDYGLPGVGEAISPTTRSRI